VGPFTKQRSYERNKEKQSGKKKKTQGSTGEKKADMGKCPGSTTAGGCKGQKPTGVKCAKRSQEARGSSWKRRQDGKLAKWGGGGLTTDRNGNTNGETESVSNKNEDSEGKILRAQVGRGTEIKSNKKKSNREPERKKTKTPNGGIKPTSQWSEKSRGKKTLLKKGSNQVRKKAGSLNFRPRKGKKSGKKK